ncbi:MAG: gamma-glutamyl-gamma-aminobutyrate hydrolase family protein [Propionibacteriaceae bacterium]
MPVTTDSPLNDVPLIGLSCYREVARWGLWEVPADLLTATYSRSVEVAGGAVALLPPQRAEAAAAIVARLDGLVITGGSDVNPDRYGDAADPRSEWNDDRDAWELALLAAADAQNIPTLGICRGLQVMSVYAGGRLEQHVPDRVGDARHSPDGPTFALNPVRTAAGSLLQSLVGAQVDASCHHHQSVATHPGLRVAALADDGTVEGLEDSDRPFWLGVQWHPEQVEDLGLFAGLVRAASPRRRTDRWQTDVRGGSRSDSAA